MELSIVIPVYNSENILENLINKISESLNKKKFSREFEIVLVNDFSFDKSWEKIKYLSEKFNNIKGINLSENYGQHNAIMAGLRNCSGEKIISMDEPEFRLVTRNKQDEIDNLIKTNSKLFDKFKYLIITQGKKGCFLIGY